MALKGLLRAREAAHEKKLAVRITPETSTKKLPQSGEALPLLTLVTTYP